MESSVCLGCYASTAKPYSPLALSYVSELNSVQDVPPPSLKHVATGVAAPAILQRPETFF